MHARHLLALPLVAVAASGCLRGPSPAPAAAATTTLRASVERVILLNGVIDLTLEIPIDGTTKRRPVVLGLPGMRNQVFAAGGIWGDYKIHWSRLKDAPPPAPAHDTVGSLVLTSPSAAVLGRTYLETISRSAYEFLPRIVDHLVDRDDVDPKRLALGGASTHGFIALQAASHDKRWAAVAAFFACADYVRFLTDSSMGMAGKPLRLDPAYEAWIHTQEVIRFPETLPPTPLLLTAHVGDPLIPIACVDTTADVLSEAYRRAGVPDHFVFARFALEGHGFAADERNAYATFLERWILR